VPTSDLTRRQFALGGAAILTTGCVAIGDNRTAASTRVAQDGSAPFRRIQDAINAAPPNGDWVIFVAPGEYPEKLFIERGRVTLIGSGPDETIIHFSQLREEWHNNHKNDWGAAVVNIRANDVSLVGLRVHNRYGDQTGDHSHQFALRSIDATRILTDDCAFVAGGADTVSLWERNGGLFYHRNCYFEGYVDQLCPRGTAFVDGCSFFTRNDADGHGWALWHEGSQSEHQKLVVRNCSFDGEPGWQLGRRHYDAAFYLINPEFSDTLADQPIFRVTYPDNPEMDRPNLWGDRVYFSNAEKQGTWFDWLADHWPQSAPRPEQMTAKLVFGGAWNPEEKARKLTRLAEMGKR